MPEPLKFQLDSLEGVAETVVPFYVKTEDGKFNLQVEGAVPKAKLDEFRNNNINLLQQLDTYKEVDLDKWKTVKSIDADEYTKLKNDALKGAKLTQEDVDKMVNERVSTMKSTFETDLKASQDQLSVVNRQLESLLVDSNVRQAATSNGVRSEAIEDVVLRAKTTFKIVDGAQCHMTLMVILFTVETVMLQ